MPALGVRPAEQRRRGRRSRGGRFRTRHPVPASRGRPRHPAREPRVTAVQGRGCPAGPKLRVTPARGRCPGCGGGPGPYPLSPSLQLAPGEGRRGQRGPAGPAPTRHPEGQPPREVRREEETGRAAAGGGGDLEEDAGAAEPPLPGLAERAGWRRHFPAAKLRPAPPPAPQPGYRRGFRLRGSQPVSTTAAGSPELRPARGKPRVPRVPEKTGPWSPSVCRARADLPSLSTCIIACAGPKWLFPKKSGKLTSRSLPTMASAPETCVMKSRGIRYPLPRPFLSNSHKHDC